MKKCRISTRIAAILLAAGMVAGDTVPALAVQTSGAEAKAAEVVETQTVEPEETESAAEVVETQTVEPEEPESAAEEMETVAETETVEMEESEPEESETEESEPDTEETKEAKTEVEETVTEEETETAAESAEAATEDAAMDVTADEVVLGDEIGVSTVIGLEGEKKTDDSLSSDDKKREKAYSNVNEGARQEYVRLAGKAEEKLDPETGLYKYNDTYYSWAVDYSSGYCSLTGRVAKIMSEEPKEDEATGLYMVDGKYYETVGTTREGRIRYYFVKASEEVSTLGTVTISNNQNVDEAAAALYGKKIADTDEKVSYYEVNGKTYRAVYANKLTDENYMLYAYVEDEISFTRHHQKLKWKEVTNQTEISANGKIFNIGYQVKVNGTDAKLGFETADGQTFTRDASFTTAEVFDAGVENVYEVRAVYYTKTKTAQKDADGKVTGYKEDYQIAKTGDWSAFYKYANEAEKELQEIPVVTNLTVQRQKNNRALLEWDEIQAATGYYVYEISSANKLTLSEEIWKRASKYTLKAGENYLRTALSGKYNYYRVVAYIDYDNDVYKQGEGNPSDVVMTEADEISADVTPVTGFYAEPQLNGQYHFMWDELPEDKDVYIFRTSDIEAFDNDDYLLDLIDAKGLYTYHAETEDIRTAYYVLDDAVNEAYKIANKKVTCQKYDGNDGMYGNVSISVDAGKTEYFVAVTVGTKNYETDRSAVTPYVGSRVGKDKKEVPVAYGFYNDIAKSSVISVTGVLEKPEVPDTKSEKNSITMTFQKQSGVTGYEIYKKNKKGKYKKLTTTTSARYTDKDLNEGTTYSYKARAYIYNTVTKKKTYSEYVAFSAETSTKNYISLTASMKGKNAVKLKWTKVAGAEKYEIYRSATASKDDTYTIKDGVKNNKKWKLIKTINKAKTVSYTDKKLNAGETYSYYVIAYYKDGKEIKTIQDSASVALKIAEPKNVKAIVSKSKVKVSWDKNAYAKKYEVKYTKYNRYGKSYTEEPVIVTTKKTSLTISNLQTGDYILYFRVRAYDGKKWSSWTSSNYNSEVCLAAVKSVTAKNITVKDANGAESSRVEISWKPVSGAAYYKVYRSTSPALQYDKDNKVYTGLSDAGMIAKESNLDELNNQVYYSEYKNGDGNYQGSIVGTKAIDGGQLQSGVTYYYFVVAYAENGKISSVGYANKGAEVTFMAMPEIRSVKAKKGKVTVSFNKVTGAKKYVVYRSEKKKTGYAAVGTTKKTSFVDKKVKKGKTYYYKVTAVGTNALEANFEAESAVVKVKAK